jgi:hypothetical protein
MVTCGAIHTIITGRPGKRLVGAPERGTAGIGRTFVAIVAIEFGTAHTAAFLAEIRAGAGIQIIADRFNGRVSATGLGQALINRAGGVVVTIQHLRPGNALALLAQIPQGACVAVIAGHLNGLVQNHIRIFAAEVHGARLTVIQFRGRARYAAGEGVA